MPDWLQEARARVQAGAYLRMQTHRRGDGVPENHHYLAPEVGRLLACADALAELMALRDRQMGSTGYHTWDEATWERARKALGGGDG